MGQKALVTAQVKVNASQTLGMLVARIYKHYADYSQRAQLHERPLEFCAQRREYGGIASF